MNVRKLHSSTQRKSMDTCGDPYLLKDVRFNVAVCKRCHAIYKNKWER